MSEGQERSELDFEVDQKNLYREEIFTDMQVATIRRLTPMNADGSKDKSREVMFVGQTHLMSPAGPLPVQARIPAQNLQQAMERFPKAIGNAVEKMVAEAEELRRKEATRIVTPEEMRGSSKIHLG